MFRERGVSHVKDVIFTVPYAKKFLFCIQSFTYNRKKAFLSYKTYTCEIPCQCLPFLQIAIPVQSPDKTFLSYKYFSLKSLPQLFFLYRPIYPYKFTVRLSFLYRPIPVQGPCKIFFPVITNINLNKISHHK